MFTLGKSKEEHRCSGQADMKANYRREHNFCRPRSMLITIQDFGTGQVHNHSLQYPTMRIDMLSHNFIDRWTGKQAYRRK